MGRVPSPAGPGPPSAEVSFELSENLRAQLLRTVELEQVRIRGFIQLSVYHVVTSDSDDVREQTAELIGRTTRDVARCGINPTGGLNLDACCRRCSQAQ
jgi:hypothetical protein